MEKAQEQEYTGVIREMNQAGDTQTRWHNRIPEQVDAARTTFNRLTQHYQFSAFRVAEPGGKSELIREFDPNAVEIVMVPQIVGG